MRIKTLIAQISPHFQPDTFVTSVQQIRYGYERENQISNQQASTGGDLVLRMHCFYFRYHPVVTQVLIQ
jgi:hypothetical protein